MTERCLCDISLGGKASVLVIQIGSQNIRDSDCGIPNSLGHILIRDAELALMKYLFRCAEPA